MPRTEPRTAPRRARGDLVEAAAHAHLLKAGLREVARNANYRGGEIDLVMLDRDTLVFIEVRYRAGARFGGGAASVDVRKRRRIVLAAQLFLAQHTTYATAPCRFDVVEADGDVNAPRLTWLRDAFRADDC